MRDPQSPEASETDLKQNDILELDEQYGLLKPLQVVRFEDLKRAGIVKDWWGLKYLIDKCGFPPGFLLGTRSRAWTLESVEKWIQSRPRYAGAIKLIGAAKVNAEHAAARRRGVSA
jgi:hypothetical protein